MLYQSVAMIGETERSLVGKPVWHPPFGRSPLDVSLNPHRRKIYAACTAALLHESSSPGEGTFDTALTNGLLAIASVSIPGHKAANAAGFMPAASKVLDDLVAEFGETSGMVEVPTGEEERDLNEVGVMIGLGHELKVRVNVDQLREALKRTQPTRHGSGPDEQLTDADLEALAVLDNHPALRCLGDRRNDLAWTRGDVDDDLELGRASAFLRLLDEEDIEARVEAAERYTPHYDDAVDLQDCPVCGHQTLVPTSADGFGYGHTSGTCVVCSYQRSEHATYLLDLDDEWEFRWKDA